MFPGAFQQPFGYPQMQPVGFETSMMQTTETMQMGMPGMPEMQVMEMQQLQQQQQQEMLRQQMGMLPMGGMPSAQFSEMAMMNSGMQGMRPNMMGGGFGSGYQAPMAAAGLGAVEAMVGGAIIANMVHKQHDHRHHHQQPQQAGYNAAMVPAGYQQQGGFQQPQVGYQQAGYQQPGYQQQQQQQQQQPPMAYPAQPNYVYGAANPAPQQPMYAPQMPTATAPVVAVAAPFAQQQPVQQPQQLSADVDAQLNADVARIHGSITSGFLGIAKQTEPLIELFSNRSPAQMELIQQRYKASYGEELHKKLQAKESGLFADLLEALAMPLAVHDAHGITKAMSGVTNERALTTLVVGRTNAQISAMRAAYAQLHHGKDLVQAVGNASSGDYRHLLTSLLQAQRNEGSDSAQPVEQDVESLYKAGSGRVLGTDEAVFISVLSTRSEGHLRQVIDQYRRTYGMTLQHSINKNFSGHILQALLYLLQLVEDRPAAVAAELHQAFEGLGTDDRRLIQLTVHNRAQPLPGLVRAAYERSHKQPLIKRLESETSGDYRKLLVAIYSQ